MKKILYIITLLVAVISTQAVAQESSIFPRGEIATNTDDYTGTIWLNILSKADSTFSFNVDLATYKPGSKLNWHIHPGGQILLITKGTGYYQEKGEPVQIVHKADVIKSSPGVEHWHAAAPNSSFAYIAVTPTQKGKTIWQQQVTENEYHNVNPPQAQKDSAKVRGASIFPKGLVAPNTDDYTGTVWLNGLSRADSVFHFNVIRAIFAPGSRLRWHIHPAGQILLITQGSGYYKEKGKPGQIVHKGDVIKSPPGVAHTHSAAPNSSFVYIAIESNRKGGVEWLKRVTDEEYHSISTQAQNK